MTYHRASWIAAIAIAATVGCTDTGDPPPRLDGGTDAGTTGDCGEVSGPCCAGSRRCISGAVCGPDRNCCGVPGGADCTRASDCCGTLDCVAGGCCAVTGSPCRTASECCGDSVCTDGLCETGSADCGAERQECCDGTTCRSGLECVDGTCLPCGDAEERCCRPPTECGTDLVCTDGTCLTPSGDCGREGQACCGGTSCTSGLECRDATCQAPLEGCTHTSCGSCTGAASRNCGWCGGSSSCLEGTATGPTTDSCASGWEFGTAATCGSDPDTCPGNTDCSSCALDSSFRCGWCANTGSCHRGTSSGADDATCTGGDWAWLSSECGSSTDACGVNSDCAACTRDSSFVCGWCADSSSCHRGTGTAPDDASCSGADWRWLSSTCMSSDPCASHSDCRGCASDTDCGWCGDSGTCMTATGAVRPPGCGGGWTLTRVDCMCSIVAGDCTDSLDCCGFLSCRAGVTFPTRCCVESGDTCASGSDCCGYMTCTGGSCACQENLLRCLADGDCCPGLSCRVDSSDGRRKCML